MGAKYVFALLVWAQLFTCLHSRSWAGFEYRPTHTKPAGEGERPSAWAGLEVMVLTASAGADSAGAGSGAGRGGAPSSNPDQKEGGKNKNCIRDSGSGSDSVESEQAGSASTTAEGDGKDDDDNSDRNEVDNTRDSKDTNKHDAASSGKMGSKQTSRGLSDEMRRAWNQHIFRPPTISEINEKMEESSQEVVNVNNITAQKELLYQQMLAQFVEPLTSRSHRSVAHDAGGGGGGTAGQVQRKKWWMDQEFALNLKGMAVLANSPKMTRHIVKGDDKAFAGVQRGVRIMVSSQSRTMQPSSSVSGLQFLQQRMVQALTHSVNANLVTLNLATVDAVRHEVQAHTAARTPAAASSNSNSTSTSTRGRRGRASAMPSRAEAVAGIMRIAEESGSGPFVFVLDDSINWLLNSEECSAALARVLRSQRGKSFFVAIEPDDTTRGGMHPAQARGAPSISSPTPQTVAGPFNPFHPQSQGSPESGAPSMHGNMYTLPSSIPPGMGPNPVVRVSGFQLVVSNGTATVTPMPPDAQLPAPPMDVIKKMMEQHQQSLQFGPNGEPVPHTATTMSFPMFPPGMSEDEIQEMMSDPDTQANMKSMMDSVMSMINEKIDSMGGPMNFFQEIERNGGSPISFPVPNFPPGGFTPPSQESSSSRSPPNESAAEDKEAVKGNRLPGMFFRRVHKQQEVKDPRSADAAVSGPESSINLDKNEKTKGEKSDKQRKGTSGISASGREVLRLFEDMSLEAPRDQSLKKLWDRMVEDELGTYIARANKRLINSELKRNNLIRVPGSLKAIEGVLSKQILHKDEVRAALSSAIKLEAGTSDPFSGAERSSNNTVSTAAEAGGARINKVRDGDIVLSHWVLDTVFSSAIGVSAPRLGKPMVRTKEEIANLAANDKYEKSLVGNIISPQDIGVTYDQIGGLEEVKEMLRQCITYPLKYPRLYQEGVASEAVKGVLLFGPPGTGKTMLAKAVATEGGATFMTIDSSTIENKWLGESEKNARAVFTLARKLSPCVIYLDEVDSILSSREHGDDSTHGTLTSVKTTLMQEWDGLRTTKDRVVVIASTNRPFDLDEAVLRRLPRRIMVELPDLVTRREVLRVTLEGNRLAPEVNLTVLAQRLEGYTGSDIKEVCREAVVRVAHERAQYLESGVMPVRKVKKHMAPGESTGSSASASSTGKHTAERESMDTGDGLVANGTNTESFPEAVAEGNNRTENTSCSENSVAPVAQIAVDISESMDMNEPLRPVTMNDFKMAMRKLKASVNENGKEIEKVRDWNEKYGEVKTEKKRAQFSHLSMYI